MISRFKKVEEVVSPRLNQEEFLEEHNRLSPKNLRTNFASLSLFKAEKPALFHGDDWSVDKLRRPFIIWLIALALDEKKV